MKAKDLIKELQKLPKDANIVIDISSDYEDYSVKIKLIQGKYSSGMGGGSFERGKGNDYLLT